MSAAPPKYALPEIERRCNAAYSEFALAAA